MLGANKDDLWKFYHKKIIWFQNRINDLNIKEGEIDKAMIVVEGFKEKIEIQFKGEIYFDETVFGK